MAKRNIDEMDSAPRPDRFKKLKQLVYGDEAETETPSGLLERMDAYTGAPTRAAISKLQDDFTQLPEAAKAAYEQFGEKPNKAPTGRDIAKKMGLDNAAAGAAMEFIADPSSLISSGAKLATLPLVGLKGFKAFDTVGDVARAVNAVDKANDAAKVVKVADEAGDIARAVGAADEVAGLSKVPTSFAESAKLKAASEAAAAAKQAEALAMEQKMQTLLQQSDIPAELLQGGLPKRPAFIGPGGVVNAGSAAEGVQLAKTVPSKFGRVVQLPDVLEMRRAQRLSKKPFESMGKVFRAKK